MAGTVVFQTGKTIMAVQSRLISLTVLVASLLPGCMDASSKPELSTSTIKPSGARTDRTEFTAEKAKAALLERMKAKDSGLLDVFDMKKLATVPLEVEDNGKFAQWGPFRFNLKKRLYFFGILARGRDDGHIDEFWGRFRFEGGRWVASAPTNPPLKPDSELIW